MAFTGSILDDAYRSQRWFVLTAGIGLIALTVILGVDLLFHLAYWSWFVERVLCDTLESRFAGNDRRPALSFSRELEAATRG